MKSGVVASSHEETSNMRSRHQSSIIVESCAGFVVLRPLSSEISPFAFENKLVVQGVFSVGEIATISELFSFCEQVQLPRRQPVHAGDLSQEDKLRIQNDPKYNSVPLPGNVWFDGHSYVDIHGTSNALRPDIAALVSAFVVDENKRIEEYNAQLRDF